MDWKFMDEIPCLQNINSWKWDDSSSGIPSEVRSSAEGFFDPRARWTRRGSKILTSRFLFFPVIISNYQLGCSLKFALIERFFQVPRSFWHDRGDAVLARPAPERAEAHTCPRPGQRLTIKGQDLSFSGFVKHYPSGWGVFLFLARRSFSISPSSRIKPVWLFVVVFSLQIWTLCRRFHSSPWNQNELSIDEMNSLYNFAHLMAIFFFLKP